MFQHGSARVGSGELGSAWPRISPLEGTNKKITTQAPNTEEDSLLMKMMLTTMIKCLENDLQCFGMIRAGSARRGEAERTETSIPD